ncbi:hypothetical protein DUI87_32577 [Hirundo rustica rustica]|uniref:Uncharacterized protein n=1 Tax=Hirundo rustica rustica TaxID=333673 RepID=A0A3M0IWQ9_HIRRU|nr:hypothetical protein DUI87_32577 [Hirundo rustica rustica]
MGNLGVKEGGDGQNRGIIWVGVALKPTQCHSTVQPGQIGLMEAEGWMGSGEASPAQLLQPRAQHSEDLELLEEAPGRSEGWSSSAGRAGVVQPGEEKLWGGLVLAFHD